MEFYTWEDPISGELFTTSEPFGEGLCLYEFVLMEFEGEVQENYDRLCWARNIEEAKGIADDYARHWWDCVVDWEDEGRYYFDDGEIGVEVGRVRPISYPEWTERQFQKALVNRIYKPDEEDTEPKQEETNA